MAMNRAALNAEAVTYKCRECGQWAVIYRLPHGGYVPSPGFLVFELGDEMTRTRTCWDCICRAATRRAAELA